MDMNFDPVPDSYRLFAQSERQRSVLYSQWTLAIAESPSAAELINELPLHKRQPNLIFAAARLVLGPLESSRGWALDLLDDQAFLSVLTEHWDQIRSIVLSRSNQTNEPTRCALHVPQLSLIKGPIALIEAGHSAGLTLIPELYSYEYVDQAGNLLRRLDPQEGESLVRLRCAIDDAPTRLPPLPSAMPEIVWRAGIDLNPLDLCVDSPQGKEELEWMKALIWPGHEDRAERIEQAAQILSRAKSSLPFHSITGDLLKELPPLIEKARKEAPGSQIVIFHTTVIAYLPDPSLFEELMSAYANDDDVQWLGCEGPEVLPGVRSRLKEPIPAGSLLYSRDGIPLAQAHPWGYWMRSLT